MRRAAATVLLALVLGGCGDPVFVPEAGPGAPGYRLRPPAPPPDVEARQAARDDDGVPEAGTVDSVVSKDDAFRVTGWALLDDGEPRGVLELVLPDGLDATVERVQVVPRPDVVDATGDPTLLWSGFTITVRGPLPEGSNVCVLSRSTRGSFRLSGSDPSLCRP